MLPNGIISLCTANEVHRPVIKSGGGPEAASGPTPDPAAELPAAAPATALAAAASTATPAVLPPWEEVEVAALLEAEKLKANERRVDGAALPEGWVDLSIEDRIL